jgi:hypothetical protein
MKTKKSEELIYWAVSACRISIDAEGRVWRGGSTRAEHLSGKYLQVRVMRHGKRVHALAHRLVWLHFNGPIPDGLTINHKNGIATDNRPENLELATPSEQVIHSRRVLLNGNQDGEKNPAAKLTDAQVREIRRRRAAGEPLKRIARDFGVTDRTISKIALGQRRQSAGA